MWQNQRGGSNSPTQVDQHGFERSDMVTLNEDEATCKKENKETRNDQAFLVSWVEWNDPENIGRFDHLGESYKTRLHSLASRSLEPLMPTQS